MSSDIPIIFGAPNNSPSPTTGPKARAPTRKDHEPPWPHDVSAAPVGAFDHQRRRPVRPGGLLRVRAQRSVRGRKIRGQDVAWKGPSLSMSGFCHGCLDRKSTRLNSSHVSISYAVFCLKKKIDN